MTVRRPVHDRTDRGSMLRIQRFLYAFAGCLGLTLGGGAFALPASSSAQAVDYQASGDAPASWLAFAARARRQLSESLSADSEPVQRINRLLERRGATESDPLHVTVKVWVTPSGLVDRVQFVSLDEEAAASLRSVLVGNDLQAAPPADMLQPMHLRLSLGRAN